MHCSLRLRGAPSTSSRRHVLALVVAAGMAVPAAALAEASEVVLAAHRAVYEFTLARASSGSGYTDMTARMVYELTGSSCDGYTQNMRFVTRSSTEDGTTAVTDLRTSSFEDGQGKSFRFNSSQYRDDELTESTSGDAARGQAGEDIRIELTRPGKKRVAIASEVLFPIQHSIQLIEAARAKKSRFEADLFDGSEKGEKVYGTTAVIGPERGAGYNRTLPVIDQAEKLNAVPAWPVVLSYFEPGSSRMDAVPVYELSFLFFANGVVRRLTLDYGDFALKGDLKTLSWLDQPRCEGKADK
jgi:hypothetical protein